MLKTDARIPVPHNGLPIYVHIEMFLDDSGQLFIDVRIHLVVSVPWFLRSVHVHRQTFGFDFVLFHAERHPYGQQNTFFQ